jgi:hypothetical protein
MNEDKWVDPRLQAKESMFQQLHLSNFETMGYARNIQQYVEQNGHDIQSVHPDYLQLLRDYEVTKNLSPIQGSELAPLCEKTDSVLERGKQAYASKAQLLGTATSALNHWRILCEIPDDLRDNDMVTEQLKESFHRHLRTWDYISSDLLQSQEAR